MKYRTRANLSVRCYLLPTLHLDVKEKASLYRTILKLLLFSKNQSYYTELL